MSQLISQYNYMKRDETDIEAYQQMSRNKRALEFVGSFLHWAFGLMDAETARDFDNKINSLNSETGRIYNISNEQTSLIKETIELNNKTLADFKNQTNRIKELMRDFQRTKEFVVGLHSDIVFTQGITIMKLIIMEHQRVLQQILHSLEDVVAGKITQLIPKEKLSEDLRHIETLLKENQKLPIDFNVENPLHIFKYSKIATSLYGNRLLLEVTLPIVERDTYTAYKVIPIPTNINNNTIIINPSRHYVLINSTYISAPISSSVKFRKCSRKSNEYRILKSLLSSYAASQLNLCVAKPNEVKFGNYFRTSLPAEDINCGLYCT